MKSEMLIRDAEEEGRRALAWQADGCLSTRMLRVWQRVVGAVSVSGVAGAGLVGSPRHAAPRALTRCLQQGARWKYMGGGETQTSPGHWPWPGRAVLWALGIAGAGLVGSPRRARSPRYVHRAARCERPCVLLHAGVRVPLSATFPEICHFSSSLLDLIFTSSKEE